MNTRDIIFQVIEYAGIPIGLMLFTIMGTKLSSADPISGTERESIWERGVELMQIICVSTILFGLSFLGHTNGKPLSGEKLIIIILSLILAIVEIVVVMLMIIKVREWGKQSIKSKQFTNIVALLYWLSLIVFIVFSHSFLHSSADDFTQSKVPNLIEAPTKKIDLIQGTASNGETLIIRRQTLLISTVSLLSVFCIAGTYLFRYNQKIRREKIIKSYSNALLLTNANTDPSRAIEKLTFTLKKTPSDSALIIDIYMKMAGIYVALNDIQNAIKQIIILQETQIYQQSVYLKDGVLSFLADLYIRVENFTEAEKIIEEISSESTAHRLSLRLKNSIKNVQSRNKKQQ